MNECLTILLECIRVEWRMFRARAKPVIVIAQANNTNRYGERTHTTSRVAWN